MSSASNHLLSAWRVHVGKFAWPTVVFFAFIVLGELAVWWGVLSARVPMWAGSIACAVLAYSAFTVLHEACHGNIHGDLTHLRWLGELAGWVSGALLLAPHPMFRVIHLHHHSHTNDPDRDPDLWVRGSRPWAVIARCLTILPAYEYSFFVGDVSQTRGKTTAMRATLLGLASFAAILLALIVAGLGSEALWLWVVPAFAASGFLAFAFDWIPHHPHSKQGRFVDTRVLLAPGITLPMLWQNYHLIHHLYPRVPFYRYARCFRDVRPELEAKGSRIEGFERGHALPKPFATPAGGSS